MDVDGCLAVGLAGRLDRFTGRGPGLAGWALEPRTAMTAPGLPLCPSQPGIVRHSRRHAGDAHELAVLRVTTGAGLRVDVLPDRCLDLGAATYRGVPLAWTSGAPMRHPADLPRNEWGVRFVGGLLATCGLDNIGPGCADAGQSFPQHGRIGGEPARDVHWGTRRAAGGAFLWITGEVAQPGTELRLRRRIIIPNDVPTVRLSDTVVNDGTQPEPVMLQYHCNFGQPFVAPGGRVIVPGTTILPRDDAAATALERWDWIEPARAGEEERVFRHEQLEQGWACSYLVPPATGPVAPYLVRLRYIRRTLPWLWQWCVLSTSAYVIGLEPANCMVKPRGEARRQNALPILEPGDQITFAVEISIQLRAAVADHLPHLL